MLEAEITQSANGRIVSNEFAVVNGIKSLTCSLGIMSNTCVLITLVDSRVGMVV